VSWSSFMPQLTNSVSIPFIFHIAYSFLLPNTRLVKNHLKHLGRTRLGVLIRHVWLWHQFHLVYLPVTGSKPTTFRSWAVFAIWLDHSFRFVIKKPFENAPQGGNCILKLYVENTYGNGMYGWIRNVEKPILGIT